MGALLTNEKLLAMQTEAQDAGKLALVRAVDVALGYRTNSIEFSGNAAYVLDQDAAELVVRSVWRTGVARANMGKLVSKHGRRDAGYDLNRTVEGVS